MSKMPEFLDWTPTEGLKVGDEVKITAPPPPTRLDMVLWRLFRYHRERPAVEQRFVVTGTGTSSDPS